jgi:hypothetical protein
MDTIQRIQAKYDKITHRTSKAGRSIWVRFQREGIHSYPAAGDNPDLEDVDFLAHPHRHIFHFEVRIAVTHNDRDIEFIQFKRWLESMFDDKVLQLGDKSCEMISDDLFETIARQYPDREVIISVSEDDENGSTITYPLY